MEITVLNKDICLRILIFP